MDCVPLRATDIPAATMGSATVTIEEKAEVPDEAQSPKKDLAFWCIFISICVALFLSALELSAVATVLPTIAHELHADDFVWVGSAYALSSTAFLPMSGGIAQIFGRRPALLGALALFALGSGLCGGASDMQMLIAGRTVQGLGGGGIQALSAIILADLVTLSERGVYGGFFGLYVVLSLVYGSNQADAALQDMEHRGHHRASRRRKSRRPRAVAMVIL